MQGQQFDDLFTNDTEAEKTFPQEVLDKYKLTHATPRRISSSKMVTKEELQIDIERITNILTTAMKSNPYFSSTKGNIAKLFFLLKDKNMSYGLLTDTRKIESIVLNFICAFITQFITKYSLIISEATEKNIICSKTHVISTSFEYTKNNLLSILKEKYFSCLRPQDLDIILEYLEDVVDFLNRDIEYFFNCYYKPKSLTIKQRVNLFFLKKKELKKRDNEIIYFNRFLERVKLYEDIYH